MTNRGGRRTAGRIPWGAKLAILGFSILGVALVLWAETRPAAKAELGPNPSATPAKVVDQVEIVEPEKTSQRGYVSVTGSLAADEDSEVASRASGTVLEVRMERGRAVAKGDVLVVLDPVNALNNLNEGEAAAEEIRVRLGITTGTTSFDPEKQPEVESARSTYELAKVNLERDLALREKNVISQADIDRRQNEYDGARQRYELARKMASQLYMGYITAQARLVKLRQSLEDMTIRAPFNGVIAEKMVSPGEAVEGGGPGAKPVARLMRTNPLRLVLTLPEQHVALARDGAPVEFTVSAAPGRTFAGRIAHIGAMVESASRSLTVEALVENADGVLRPGYFATARLFYPSGQDAYAVPASAVLRQGDVARVFVVRDGVAREQIVTVGDETAGRALVTGGIGADDRVVADASRVSDGAKVR
jgi:membrane fusion protein (multidrug efflux system)